MNYEEIIKYVGSLSDQELIESANRAYQDLIGSSDPDWQESCLAGLMVFCDEMSTRGLKNPFWLTSKLIHGESQAPIQEQTSSPLDEAACSASSDFGGDAAFNYTWNKVNTHGKHPSCDAIIKSTMQKIWDTIGEKAYQDAPDFSDTQMQEEIESILSRGDPRNLA